MTEEAFRAIYNEYRDPLLRFGYRMTGSRATAEDLVHDCLLSLLRSNFAARPDGLKTYLYRAVRNLACRHYRDTGREYDGPEPDIATVLDAMVAQEAADAIRCAVEALPPLQREALILFEYDDLSLEEISAVVGVELAAVKSRLHRTRAGLRRMLLPLKEVAR